MKFPLVKFHFFLFFRRHKDTRSCGAVIDPFELSKIQLETGYCSSFCTLSVDPRENKGLRCIQNKEMGRNAHLSKKGRRGESSTHPQGRSQSLTSDLPLKEGNSGEGEGNMFEQSE